MTDVQVEKLQALCLAHRVKALFLFGSGARGDFDPEQSDLDFLVEFLPQKRGGFDDISFRLHEDLEKLFDRDVDLVERHVIERSENYIRRNAILTSLQPVYAAA